MLVISRKPGEGIVIDGGIKISIFEVRGEIVKIGIEAPKETLILRDELSNSIRQENVESANSSVESAELLDSLISKLSLKKKD